MAARLYASAHAFVGICNETGSNRKQNTSDMAPMQHGDYKCSTLCLVASPVCAALLLCRYSQGESSTPVLLVVYAGQKDGAAHGVGMYRVQA
jgi:hypothetical protein